MPVQHVQPVVAGGELVGELPRPVGRGVVHDEGVGLRDRRGEPAEDQLEVVDLVVGGDDDQHAAVGPRPARRSPRRSARRRRRPAPAAASSAPTPSTVSTASGTAPSRAATVVELRWAIGSSNTAGVNCADRRTRVPSGATTAEMPLVAATTTVRPVLDRAQPADRQLLGALVAAPEGRVVGLHDEHAGAAVHHVGDQVVLDDLEADDVTDAWRRRGTARRGGCPAAKSARTRSTLSVNSRKKSRAGTYSAKGTGCRLT